MATTSAWCPNCDIKFQVKSDGKEPVSYCPFCGEATSIDDDEDDELEEE